DGGGLEQRAGDAAMQRGQDRIADELGVERQVEHDRAVLDARAHAEPGAIGHRSEKGRDVDHARASSGMSMKAPVAIGRRLSARVWNGCARAKATSRPILMHSDSTMMSISGMDAFMWSTRRSSVAMPWGARRAEPIAMPQAWSSSAVSTPPWIAP